MKKQNLIERAVVRLAHQTSKKSANEICMSLFYQPELPQEVKRMKKHVG